MTKTRFQTYNHKTTNLSNKINKKRRKTQRQSMYKTSKSYVRCAESQNVPYFVVEFVEEDIIKNVFRRYFPMITFSPLLDKFNRLE